MSGEHQPWLPAETKLIAVSLILAVVLLGLLWWIATLLMPAVPSIVAARDGQYARALPRLLRREGGR
ncbi:MAG: hypothetical protein LM577_01515 [Thermoproteaceae archaeon]|jgi:hypothetical protein|nr:hypothetical protein [Thermoproteaceae archaeon]